MEWGGKTKDYLIQKKLNTTLAIEKLKKKRHRIKVIYIVVITSSIVLSSTSAIIAVITGLPVFVVPILALSSAILTGITVRFNFQVKKEEIKRLITEKKRIENALEYIITTNGNTTEEEFKKIINDF
jgi:hypothetical protein